MTLWYTLEGCISLLQTCHHLVYLRHRTPHPAATESTTLAPGSGWQPPAPPISHILTGQLHTDMSSQLTSPFFVSLPIMHSSAFTAVLPLSTPASSLRLVIVTCYFSCQLNHTGSELFITVSPKLP